MAHTPLLKVVMLSNSRQQFLDTSILISSFQYHEISIVLCSPLLYGPREMTDPTYDYDESLLFSRRGWELGSTDC